MPVQTKKPDLRFFSVCVPQDIVARLDAQAQREGERSRSNLIRRAIVAYLTQHAPQKSSEEGAVNV